MSDHQYPLFVYGTLMSTEGAHARFAAAAIRCTVAWLDGAVLHDLGPYPMIVRGRGRVFGELHWLRPDLYVHTLKQLDVYEGDEYERILCPIRAESGTRHRAWVYFGLAAIARQFPVRSCGRWRGADA